MNKVDSSQVEEGNQIYGKHGYYSIRNHYAQAISKNCNGISVVFLEPNKKNVETYAKIIDGLLIPGNSNDIDPSKYGEKPIMEFPIEKYRTEFELSLIHKIKEQRKPILGICGGYQSINIAFGGSLYQDIPSQKTESKINHNTKDGTIIAHEVEIKKFAEEYFGKGAKRFAVNSLHHQAVKDLGEGLTSFAKSDDGLIEGIAMRGYPFLVGVQWHPEFELSKYDTNLIKSFCNAVKNKDDTKSHIKAKLVQ